MRIVVEPHHRLSSGIPPPMYRKNSFKTVSHYTSENQVYFDTIEVDPLVSSSIILYF
jgi:hypothetical protein